MASAAYLALLEQPSVLWVVLAELTARELLKGWASAGSGAYDRAWDPYTHPTTLRADRGLYRELVGVWENGTPLTVRASVAAVQANPGSYYFDGSTLTVQTSGSVDPDTLASVQAVFTVRLATEPMAFADLPPYDAQVDGARLPSVRMDQPELLRGTTSFPSGDLTVTNADGFWDYPVAAWIWTNAVVACLAGDPSMAYADYEPVLTMQVARTPTAGDVDCVWQLRSRMNATNRAFPSHVVGDFGSWLPYGSTAVDASASLPAAWGYIVDAPLVFVGFTGPRNRWAAVDPFVSVVSAWHSLAAIERATGARTALTNILTGGSDYIDLGGAGDVIEIITTWDPADYDIVATVTCGPTTAGAVAQAVLVACGVPLAEIATATFDQVDLDMPETVGIWVGVRPGADRLTSLRTGTEMLNDLERGLLSVFIGADGLWTARAWDPSFDWAGLSVLTDADLYRLSPVTGVTSHPVAAVAVRYGRRIYDDLWSSVSRSSDEAAARLDAEETETVDTVLAFASEAAQLASRLLLVGQQSPLELDAELGSRLMTAVPGDQVRLQRARGASLTGTVDVPMEIIAITKSLAGMATRVRLSNQRGVGPLAKVAAADSVAAWASASADEMMQYAFACDDQGFVDASDPATFRQAVAV